VALDLHSRICKGNAQLAKRSTEFKISPRRCTKNEAMETEAVQTGDGAEASGSGEVWRGAGKTTEAAQMAMARQRDEMELLDWIDSKGASKAEFADREAAREGVEADRGPSDQTQRSPPKREAVTPSLSLGETPAFPTPDPTPFASASASFAFPASPSGTGKTFCPPDRSAAALAPVPPPPTSPRRLERPVLPVDRLIPAGTVVLRGYRLSEIPYVEPAEDGWLPLSRELLEPLPPVSPPLESGPFSLLPPAEPDAPASRPLLPPQPPSPPVGKKKRKRKASVPDWTTLKRKTSGSGSSSPRKKVKLTADPLLDDILSCSAALVLRSTVRMVDNNAVLRIYLIPQDLPELWQPEYAKGRLKRPPSSTVYPVLYSVRSSPSEWNGAIQSGDVPHLMDEKDERSLLEIFHDIELPAEEPSFVLDAPGDVKERLTCAVKEQPDDILTDLYPYQRASLAKMLARELAPQRTVPPMYLARQSLFDPAANYFVSLNGGVELSPALVQEPKAGILAEDMGVGKTLIIIALVMSTRSELPCLDGISTYLDGSLPSPPPVLLTAQSLYFPFEAERAQQRRLKPRVPEPLLGYEMDVHEELAYQEALARQAEEDAEEPDYALPTLRALMIHLIKTTPVPVRYPADDETLNNTGLHTLLDESFPFYRVFPSPAQLDSREGRKGVYKPLEIVVAATTLIVVPTDLVRQWEAEVKKHVAPGALRVLALRTSKDKFRPPQEMAKFDAVLMSVARFADAAETGDTTLRGVHWKRLVVDEGHVLSSGNLTRKLAEELRCECRWAVSGTPSTNLRGAATEGEGALSAASTTVGGDRTDLDRLGQLFSRFFQHPSFPRHSSLRTLVMAHAAEHGERPSRLKGVFDRAIVRHRSDLVKPTLELPPLTVRIVHLEMEEAERKMYNALIAIFASNSITSQRTDQDYLFHASQRRWLDELCDNLATATTFFGSSEIEGRLYDAIRWAHERLDSAKSSIWSDEDRQGLRKAAEVMQEALDDREWRIAVGGPAVAAEVTGFNDDLIKEFMGLSASKNPLGRSLISLHELVRLRQDLRELRHADVKQWDDDEELVEEVLTFEARRKRADIESASRKAAKDQEQEQEQVFKKRPKNDSTPVVPLPGGSVFGKMRLVRTTSTKINHVLDELRRYPNDKFIVFSSSNVDLLFANLSETLDLFGIRHLIFAGSHARSGDRGLKAQKFNSTTAEECQVILVDAKLGGRGIGLTAACRVIMMEPIWKPGQSCCRLELCRYFPIVTLLRCLLQISSCKRRSEPIASGKLSPPLFNALLHFADRCVLSQTKPVDLQILVIRNTYEDALLRRRAKVAPEGAFQRSPRSRYNALVSLTAALNVLADFSKRVKLPQQDNELRDLLQRAYYLEPSPRAKDGPISKALDPPANLVVD
ncbi:SPOSA6832_02032, partial [Sporobolomyces salmonicolor]